RAISPVASVVGFVPFGISSTAEPKSHAPVSTIVVIASIASIKLPQENFLTTLEAALSIRPNISLVAGEVLAVAPFMSDPRVVVASRLYPVVYERANVPDVVIGLPDREKPVGTDISTE